MSKTKIIGAQPKTLNEKEIIELFKDYIPLGNNIAVVPPRVDSSIFQLSKEDVKKKREELIRTKGAKVISMGTAATRNSEIKVGNNVMTRPTAMPLYGIEKEGYSMVVFDVNDICLIIK